MEGVNMMEQSLTMLKVANYLAMHSNGPQLLPNELCTPEDAEELRCYWQSLGTIAKDSELDDPQSFLVTSAGIPSIEALASEYQDAIIQLHIINQSVFPRLFRLTTLPDLDEMTLYSKLIAATKQVKRWQLVDASGRATLYGLNVLESGLTPSMWIQENGLPPAQVVSDLIRSRRRALGLTLEQAGDTLGISAKRFESIENKEINGKIRLRALRKTLGHLGMALQIESEEDAVPGTGLAECIASYRVKNYGKANPGFTLREVRWLHAEEYEAAQISLGMKRAAPAPNKAMPCTEVAGQLIAKFGVTITSVLAGGLTSVTATEWSDGSLRPSVSQEIRLRFALDIWDQIENATDSDSAHLWFLTPKSQFNGNTAIEMILNDQFKLVRDASLKTVGDVKT